MKKNKTRKSIHDQDEMRSEYDLRGSKGVRGKYHQAMRDGYTITIHKKDGTTAVKEVKPKRTILLEPDLQAYFPDSESVNAALRALIPTKRVAMTRETPSAYTTRRTAKPKHSNHKSPHTLPHK
jgi:hypothetical protein